jgi:hypothetical protein
MRIGPMELRAALRARVAVAKQKRTLPSCAIIYLGLLHTLG